MASSNEDAVVRPTDLDGAEIELSNHDYGIGYYLNPQFQYSRGFSVHAEIMKGLKEVIKTLEPDIRSQNLAMEQIEIFRYKQGSFSTENASTSFKTMQPGAWWSLHGESAPNLQKIAVRALSQTCSTSGCERNWSTFSLIHTKTRNRLTSAKLDKIVFVHYNMRLRVRNQNRQAIAGNDTINLDYIFEDDSPLEPWLSEREEPVLDEQSNEWLEEVIGTQATQPRRKRRLVSQALLQTDEEATADAADSPSDDNAGDDGDGGQQGAGTGHDTTDRGTEAHETGHGGIGGARNLSGEESFYERRSPIRDPSPRPPRGPSDGAGPSAQQGYGYDPYGYPLPPGPPPFPDVGPYGSYGSNQPFYSDTTTGTATGTGADSSSFGYDSSAYIFDQFVDFDQGQGQGDIATSIFGFSGQYYYPPAVPPLPRNDDDDEDEEQPSQYSLWNF